MGRLMITKKCNCCGEVKTYFQGNECNGCRFSPASGGANITGINRVGALSQIKTA